MPKKGKKITFTCAYVYIIMHRVSDTLHIPSDRAADKYRPRYVCIYIIPIFGPHVEMYFQIFGISDAVLISRAGISCRRCVDHGSVSYVDRKTRFARRDTII